jgi:glycosyltransferase involved in cell wall biosynthesis
VIPCAVSSDFKPFTKIKKDYVLAVSSISPHKNFRSLVLAFNKLDLNNLELRIVGDVSKNFSDAGLVSLINTNENIKLLGRISDKELAQIYSSALCFVYPSLYEGFGIPPLEAQASGCPCLVSTAASLPEVCGDSVLYCDPYSIDDITLKLQILVTDSALRQKLKMLGFDNVKRFSWNKSALDMIELIEEIQ